MRVDFTIPSAPVPKSRPRFNTNTGRAFTDDKTRIFENIVSLAYGARHYFDDNYIKSVLDGLNGKAFKDDRYVYAVLAEKEYAKEASIEVSIESV